MANSPLFLLTFMALFSASLVAMVVWKQSDHVSEEETIQALSKALFMNKKSPKLTAKFPVKSVPATKKRHSHPLERVSLIGDLDFSTLWQNEYNLVHVVQTEFLQFEASHELNALSQARMDLFQTFTLPSMRQQSNNQYLWLIWTDASLPQEYLSMLQDALQDMPNAIVLGGQPSATSNLRTLYGLKEWKNLVPHVMIGNAQLLQDYHQASTTHLLVETRLDADDALSATFVESMQAQAAVALGRNTQAKPGVMEVYCPEAHVEWRYYKPESSLDEAHNDDDGHLVHYKNAQFCINSGLSQAYNLDNVKKPRKLQNVNNCEGDTLIDCGNGGGSNNRQLSQLFFGDFTPDHKSHDQTPIHSKSSLRNNNKNHKSHNHKNKKRDLLTLDDILNQDNKVCPSASPIPLSAHVDFLQNELKQLTDCQAGSMSCRSLTTTKTLLMMDDQDNQYADGLLVGNDLAYLKQEMTVVSECTPVDCDRDRVFVQTTMTTNEFGDVNGIAVEIVGGSDPYAVEQLTVHYANTTSTDYSQQSQGCAAMFAHLDVDGNLGAGDSALLVTPAQIEAAEDHIANAADMNCAKTEMVALAICLKPDVYQTPDTCKRRLRLLPELVNDEVKDDKDYDQDIPKGDDDKATFQYIPLQASVLMAKTPTAAGFKNVMPDAKGGGHASFKLPTFERTSQTVAWQSMEQLFGVQHDAVLALRSRFQTHMEAILIDAFASQCSPGHSCKESTKRSLGKLLTHVQLKNSQRRMKQ